MSMHSVAAAIAVALFSFFACAHAGSYLISGSTLQNMSINASINYTENFINNVNSSSYLLFYPNLGNAYAYLSKAENVSKSNQSYAYTLLNKALDSATAQQESIYRYRFVSFVVLVAVAIAISVYLYSLMIPYKKKGSKKQNK